MNGLGYGLTKIGSDYYYNCVYQNNPFTVLADLKDIKMKKTTSWEYDNYDLETGEPIGEPRKVEFDEPEYNITKEEIEAKIEAYWNNTEKNSEKVKKQYAKKVGKTNLDDVDFYENEKEALKAIKRADFIQKVKSKEVMNTPGGGLVIAKSKIETLEKAEVTKKVIK